MSDVSLAIIAPLSGPIVALDTVPDPVFAQKMVGDGISIDPTSNTLTAPFDGQITLIHRAGHAVTLKAANGIEVMMHIGIDTVSLKGAGFTSHVKVDQHVKLGDSLISFDLDFVGSKSKSLLTQIIVTNSDEIEKFVYSEGVAQVGETPVLTLTPKAANITTRNNDQTQRITSQDVAVPNPTGLHARPAAVLVNAAKQFDAIVHLYKGENKANTKSLVSIMSLEISCGDLVNLVASGSQAQEAIDHILPLIESGLGENCPPIPASQTHPKPHEMQEEPQEPVRTKSSNPNRYLGVNASAGLAIGEVFQLVQTKIHVTEYADDSAHELTIFDSAIKQAMSELKEMEEKLEDKEKAAIFAAHQALLDDPELIDNTKDLIADKKTAAFAWRASYNAQSDTLSHLKNELLAARANDLRDVGRRVLKILSGDQSASAEIPQNAILIAEDLTPSDTANLDTNKVLGFCTMTGGASSHVAILARSMNLPALAGIEGSALKIENGTKVILDADNGALIAHPSDEKIASIIAEQKNQAEKKAEDLSNAHKAAITQDGTKFEIVANIAGLDDAKQCPGMGAEGVGLLRSEFIFMNRASAPTEDEQTQTYTDIVKTLSPNQPLIIRTLDVGGDKPLPYLPIETEENPFLGLRGIRVTLKKQGIFRTQLRAILRAAEHGNIHVMFPMITTMDDLLSAKVILEEERVKLGAAPIKTGIMVEVPTTAVMAEQFAKEVDFFSIGTNDLTQYSLAIDRGHALLAAQADGLNPGVLKLIEMTIKGSHKHGKWTGVCGGIASDPLAVPLLVGMGVDELSASIPSIPSIKAQIRGLDVEACKALTQKALTLDSAQEIRDLVKSFMNA